MAEGTFRPSRHRHLLARPLPRRRPPGLGLFEQRLRLVTNRHWRYDDRQLNLARFGPSWVWFDEKRTPEVQALARTWEEWDLEYGLAWRLQNECPSQDDERRLGRLLGHWVTPEHLLGAVGAAVTAWDPSLPDPPGWDRVGEESFTRARLEARDDEGGPPRAGCGTCGTKVVLLPAAVAAAVPEQSLPALRAALSALRDEDGFRFTVVDQTGHFPCPRCGTDQYLENQAHPV